jgi:hypothetical protein
MCVCILFLTDMCVCAHWEDTLLSGYIIFPLTLRQQSGTDIILAACY